MEGLEKGISELSTVSFYKEPQKKETTKQENLLFPKFPNHHYCIDLDTSMETIQRFNSMRAVRTTVKKKFASSSVSN